MPEQAELNTFQQARVYYNVLHPSAMQFVAGTEEFLTTLNLQQYWPKFAEAGLQNLQVQLVLLQAERSEQFFRVTTNKMAQNSTCKLCWIGRMRMFIPAADFECNTGAASMFRS